MGFLLAFVLSFAPAIACAAVVYWLDRYEREPLRLLIKVFLWGAIVAVGMAVVAQLALAGAVEVATGSPRAAEIAGATLFAPVTEESLKGIAVLLVFFFLRREFDSVLDGIVYASFVALGFGATENLFYLYGEYAQTGFQGMAGLFVMRVVFGIWDHPFYTSFIGIGLALSRLSRSLAIRWLAPPFGWGVALGFHSLHNGLATLAANSPAFAGVMLLVDWSGWLAISILILVSIRREGRLLGWHLAEEVELGRLSREQYRTAVSSFGQSGARLRAFARGRLRATSRFYQVCGELAHKKEQLARLGEEEHGNGALVEQLRSELAGLSPDALA